MNLWEAYWKEPTTENRNALVLENMGLVYKHAGHWFKHRNEHGFDFHDYVSWGAFGLLNAIERYRPSLGAFSTYAFVCIRTQIITGVNSVVYDGKRNKQIKRLIRGTQSLGGWQGTTPDHTRELIETEHNRATVRSLIDRFVADWQKECFELHYLEAKEPDEIASQLGIKKSRVYQMLCMGKQRIKALLERNAQC